MGKDSCHCHHIRLTARLPGQQNGRYSVIHRGIVTVMKAAYAIHPMLEFIHFPALPPRASSKRPGSTRETKLKFFAIMD